MLGRSKEGEGGEDACRFEEANTLHSRLGIEENERDISPAKKHVHIEFDKFDKQGKEETD